MVQAHALTVADHTRLMKAVFDRPLNIIRYLDRPLGTVVTPKQFLDAVVQVRAFDPEVRALWQQARATYSEIEAYREQMPPATLAAIEALGEKIADQPVDEVLRTLAEERAREQDDELAQALDFAQELVRDGADTIYSPDYSPAEYLAPSPVVESAGRAGAGIVAGDVTGGLIGFFSPVPGGAVIGAGVASAAGAVTAVVVEVLS